MSDVDYIALAFEPHGNVTMRQLRRAALREREAKASLAARLAEVEAERDTAAERWINTAKALADAQTERDGLLMQNDLGGERLREMASERDRLAQRGVELLEKVQLFAATGQRVTQERDEAIGHLRAVMNAERQAPPHRPQEDDEALAFLARFPREGDEG